MKSLFSKFGIEIEYMIVQKKNLKVLALADEVLLSATTHKKNKRKSYTNTVSTKHTTWSNELALHVIELKTSKPLRTLVNADISFHKDVQRINKFLAARDAQLLGTGAHPCMDPRQETKLWPHGDNIIYKAYDQIFGCSGHGWSNLQSVHLNLPFANDQEFAILHTAIRLLLPIIPALSASTPFLDGQQTNYADSRLWVYAQNQKKIPSIIGDIIPEPITKKKDYEKKILNKIYQDIAPYDPQKILQYEWLNSRAAIARFERDAIEIRIIDTQEAPCADLAIVSLIVAVLKLLSCEKWLTLTQQLTLDTKDLKEIFLEVIQAGDEKIITNHKYLQAFGVSRGKISVKHLWQELYIQAIGQGLIDKAYLPVLSDILIHGNLTTRILTAIHQGTDLLAIYHNLGRCLATNTLFMP